MRLFDLSLQLNGYKINKALRLLKSLQDLTTEQKVTDILSRRDGIVKYHIEHNSFYNNYFLKTYNGNWEDVPILTKKELQQPLKNRLSKGFKPSQVYVNKTSGSSGDPFIFAKDKWCHAMTWAQIIDRFGWYQIDFNHSKQARFYGIPLDLFGNKKERLKDSFAHRYRFSVFDLSDKAFEQALKKFKSASFDYINGYTSPIVQFAKFLKRKNIVLTDLCPRLKVCVVTSEMLFEQDKKIMESSFGVPVVNEYGASELDLIAFENPKGEWQLNNDTLYVEIVDEQDQILPFGEEGRVVITSLFNRAHPFIRYDLGDIGSIDKESTLDKPLLKTLVGRTNDLVKLPSGKTAAGLTFYYITKSVIEDGGNVKEFVIEQLKEDTFKIIYSSSNPIPETQKQDILNAFSTYLEPGLLVEFQREDTLARQNSGKLKQFTSYI